MGSIVSQEHILKGQSGAPGLVSGPVYQWPDRVDVSMWAIAQDVDSEMERLDAACRAAGEAIAKLKEKVALETDASHAAIFEAHLMFLEDRALREAAESAISRGSGAEAAWQSAFEDFAARLEAIPDETLSARAADLRDVGRRVLGLLNGSLVTFQPPDTPSVIVARDLSPSDTASMDKRLTLAICTAQGSPTSHAAILARALALPSVVGLGEEVLALPSGAPVLVDGDAGQVTAFPDTEQVRDFQMRAKQVDEQRVHEQALAGKPAVTLDGHRVRVLANIAKVDDVEGAVAAGAEGIGLLRTEFLYLNRSSEPLEDEQVQIYQDIFERLGTRPVIVRTLDVGGDKSVPYLKLRAENNPFLGYRGIRICLDRPVLFEAQLRALLRASPGHNLHIMFPFVATLDDIQRAREFLDKARESVVQEGHLVADKVAMGVMIEVPSAVVLADRIAPLVDFFSVGTNDLVQYLFAADRTNEAVSAYGDGCHPALLQQMERVIAAGREAGIPVGVCGELAADPMAVPLLVGLGMDEISMSVSSIPGVKARIRSLSVGAVQDLAREAMKLDTAEAVRGLVGESLRGQR